MNTTTYFLSILFISFLLFGCDKTNDERNCSEVEDRLAQLMKEKNIDPDIPIKIEDAEQVEDERVLKDISISIIKTISEDKVSEAFDIMQKYSPLPSQEFEKAKEQSVKQLDFVKPRFGEYIGYEFISSSKVGDSIIKHNCIVKCEIFIIRWEFIYYKPKDKWIMTNFKWDDQIRLLK